MTPECHGYAHLPHANPLLTRGSCGCCLQTLNDQLSGFFHQCVPLNAAARTLLLDSTDSDEPIQKYFELDLTIIRGEVWHLVQTALAQH